MTDGERTTARHAAKLRGAVILDHLATGHELPVSNGWTRYGGAVAVWCGWCRHLYRPDITWAHRYLTTRWINLRRAALSTSNRTTMAYAGRKVREARDALRAAGLPVNWPTP